MNDRINPDQRTGHPFMSTAIIAFLSLALPTAFLMDMIGLYFRALGAGSGEQAIGYSAHTKISTLGRFFIMVSSPMLGILVDRGFSFHDILLVGCLVYSVYTIGSLAIYRWNAAMIVPLYRALTRRSPGAAEPARIGGYPLQGKLLFFSVLAFLFWALGVITVNLVATLLPEYRASIVQMSAVITSLGTIMHVFYVDARLARDADLYQSEIRRTIATIALGRIIVGFVLSFLFWGTYLALPG